jgi:LAO/AO transport system kinase
MSSDKKNINPAFRKNGQFLSKRKRYSAEQLVEGILEGNKMILSQAITLIESKLESDRALIEKVISACLPYSGNATRIGITGVPGVGKSTFIESFGLFLIKNKKKLAVLAIDPSSSISKGSILGDKTRMEELTREDNAYIRPSPSGETLGGVSNMTREAMVLSEAAGYDTILIETVGVGQSETAVHSMTDVFLLLAMPGTGDELQGIKKGILEMADIVAVNKSDGAFFRSAEVTHRELNNVSNVLYKRDADWVPLIQMISGLKRKGILDLWNAINTYLGHTKSNGFFEKRRINQQKQWLIESIDFRLKQKFYSNPMIKAKIAEIENEIENDNCSVINASNDLIRLFTE